MNYCKHCEPRIEEMDELVRIFWDAYDLFGNKLGFIAYRERYLAGINFDDYCSCCKSWYRQRFLNTTSFDARQRGIK